MKTMKSIFFASTILLLTSCMVSEELKPYKKMKPAQVMALDKELEKAKKSLKTAEKSQKTLESSVKSMEKKMKSLESENERKDKQLADMLTVIEKIKEQNSGVVEKANTPTKSIGSDGIEFMVQVGAFKSGKTPLSIIEINTVIESSNGYDKYLVGPYATLAEANAERQKLKIKGFRDSWIVGYNNGARMDAKQAEALRKK